MEIWWECFHEKVVWKERWLLVRLVCIMRGSTVQLSLKALIRCWALSHNSAGCLMPMSDDLPLPHILAVCDRGVSVNDGHHGLARYSSVAYLY